MDFSGVFGSSVCVLMFLVSGVVSMAEYTWYITLLLSWLIMVSCGLRYLVLGSLVGLGLELRADRFLPRLVGFGWSLGLLLGDGLLADVV